MVQLGTVVGSVTVSNTNTTGTVTFKYAEPDANYKVICTPSSVSGTPAASSTIITRITKTTTNFVVTVAAAPGAGNSVTFDYIIGR